MFPGCCCDYLSSSGPRTWGARLKKRYSATHRVNSCQKIIAGHAAYTFSLRCLKAEQGCVTASIATRLQRVAHMAWWGYLQSCPRDHRRGRHSTGLPCMAIAVLVLICLTLKTQVHTTCISDVFKLLRGS